MKFRILPYKLGSESAKLLSEGLEGKRINPIRNTYRKGVDHKLVNWGCSQTPYERLFGQGDLNHPASVALAADKLVTYQLLESHGVPTVTWTKDKAVAESWLGQSFVYGRNCVSGHSGQGITVYQASSGLPDHLFYTKGVDNKYEYRIHVGKGRVIDITQKRRRNGHADADPTVRSYDNGWVFCRNDIKQPSNGLIQAAIDSCHYLDLDFGAVDVCCGHDGRVTVFEINTAPGIEGTTLQRYVNFFKECVNG